MFGHRKAYIRYNNTLPPILVPFLPLGGAGTDGLAQIASDDISTIGILYLEKKCPAQKKTSKVTVTMKDSENRGKVSLEVGRSGYEQ
jgi:hypothetical protein